MLPTIGNERRPMTENYSESAKKVLLNAFSVSNDLGHSYVGSEHLLLGILSNDGSFSVSELNKRGIYYKIIKKRIISISGTLSEKTKEKTSESYGISGIDGEEKMTPKCRTIIKRATAIAENRGGKTTAEHLLMALISEECVGLKLITASGVDTTELYRKLEDNMDFSAERVKVPLTPLLDKISVDLTAKAARGLIDPVIGRSETEEKLIRILLRRSKNNPCLIGEAGVGKTAVVEGLALRISEGNVPMEMRNLRLVSIDISSVVAGTKYRGEFEEKLKSIIEEVKTAGNIILFIDEIHCVVGAGAAEGAIDASNILKPPLARGEIRLIGATTIKEYKKYIEKDGALERRFRKVTVNEPNETECVEILKGIRGRYELHHGVEITNEAIKAAVSLSERYISDRFLPDKAIDLMDEAASRAKLKDEFAKVEKKDVEEVLEEMTGIPISVMNRTEKAKILMLEAEMNKRLPGQEYAVNILCSAVRRMKTGIKEQNKPIGAFLFVGPPGVGKTECARVLSEVLFGNSKSLVRFDMSEYSEKHSATKLIGAPPGYAGYGEGGILTEKIRLNPYSVLLLDEIEKAHPDVKNVLLQIMDEGVLTDSNGTRVSFQNSVIIMTSNCYSGYEGEHIAGFCKAENHSFEKRFKLARKSLSSELADRIDEVVVFEKLSVFALEKIAKLQSEKLSKRLAERGVCLGYDESFIRGSAEECYNKGGSAREIKRILTRKTEELVSAHLLSVETENPSFEYVDGIIYMEEGKSIFKKNSLCDNESITFLK